MPSFNVGGREMRFAQIANHFAERFHHIILPLDGNTSCTSLLSSHVSYDIIDAHKASSVFGRLRSQRKQLHDIQPDKLITYNWGAIEWAMCHWFTPTEHIHIEDGFGPDEAQQQLFRRKLLRRIALHCTHKTIVPSMKLHDIALNEWRLNNKKVVFIPNGVDLNILTNPDLDTYSIMKKDQGIAIGTIARIRKEKNLIRLIESFEQVRNQHSATLWIAGDGPELSHIQQRAAESPHSNDIHFLGNVEKPQDFLVHLDIFALSSDTEQMPYSILEACGSGLPIASVDVGDIKNLVSSSNKSFVTGNQTNELTHSLLSLIDIQEQWKSIGESNRAFCREHFSIDAMLNAYYALFSSEGHSKQPAHQIEQ